VPSPISVRLDDATKARLEREAAADDRPVSDLAQMAIAEYLDRRQIKRSLVSEALAQAEADEFISDEAMSAWVNSWGEDDELPVPSPDIKLPR